MTIQTPDPADDRAEESDELAAPDGPTGEEMADEGLAELLELRQFIRQRSDGQPIHRNKVVSNP